jgi:hypothetical protein
VIDAVGCETLAPRCVVIPTGAALRASGPTRR